MDRLEKIIQEEISKLLEGNRDLGKQLSDIKGKKLIKTYRAVAEDVDTFKDKDFVTLSLKFAVEHAESNAVTQMEPQQVIVAMIPSENLYEATNPGEYIYSGEEVKGEVAYKTKGVEEYEGYEELTSDDFLAEDQLGEGIVAWLKRKSEWAKEKSLELKKAGVREGYETVLAAKILLNIVKKRSVTTDEVKFLKSQAVDLAKVVAILGLQAVPGNNAIVKILDSVFKKANIPFSFYPDSHNKEVNKNVLAKAYPDKDLAESIQRRLNEINEELYNLEEIDWEGDFKDVKKSCMRHEEMAEYLNKVRANAFKDYKDREKMDKGKPFIHAKSSFFEKGKETVDVDQFIQQITKMPNNLVNTNEKILKTGLSDQFVYKTGIPAFRGLAYDKDKGKFYVINTCPGAGECVFICYAMKGNYVRYPVSYDSMTRRLNFLLNDPKGFEQQLYNELKEKAIEHNALEDYDPEVIVRWNDSGDFFSQTYVDIANRVIEKLQKDGYNVNSYAYTKMANVAKGDKFGSTSFSSGANKKQSKKAGDELKQSKIIPKELFADLEIDRKSHSQELKNRVAKKFGLNPQDILTYKELMKTGVADSPKYSVIVKPGDGDDAAMRNDVKNVLLTQH